MFKAAPFGTAGRPADRKGGLLARIAATLAAALVLIGQSVFYLLLAAPLAAPIHASTYLIFRNRHANGARLTATLMLFLLAAFAVPLTLGTEAAGLEQDSVTVRYDLFDL